MRKPSIHINGSSAEALMKGYRNAHRSIQNAMDALTECGPHGRDYYVQDPGPSGLAPLYEAVKEHATRLDALKKVQDELMEIMYSIQDQQDARKR
jgi:hypothetical protein